MVGIAGATIPQVQQSIPLAVTFGVILGSNGNIVASSRKGTAYISSRKVGTAYMVYCSVYSTLQATCYS